jgi:hypothetical protein
MTLPAFIFFMTGLIMEALWLLANAGGRSESDWVRKTLGLEAAVLVVGALLAGLVALFGGAQVTVSLDDAWVGWIFVILGLFLLAAGILAPTLLPRVSEQSILIVQFIILVNLFQPGVVIPIFGMLIFSILPILLILWLVLRKTSPSPILKLFIYFWYLIILVAQTFLSGQMALFNQPALNLFEGFTFGAVFFFIILHGLFLVRFFLIITSLILPRNRKNAIDAIRTIFFDDQISIPSFLLFMLATAAITVLLNRFQIPMANLWTSLLIVLIIQLAFNPSVRRQFEQSRSRAA